MMEPFEKIARLIREAERICIFTGAGISCPSGIPDFRSATGLYNQKNRENYPPEEIISHDFLLEKPECFYRFYKERMLFPKAKPNNAHLFFAGLEKTGKDISVVTQNIDGLHQMAGSTKVFEIHGSAHRNFCTQCGKSFSMEYVLASDGIPLCDEDRAMVRPEVVLYGESLPEQTVMQAIHSIEQAELLFVVGTSLAVYPAASFLHYYHGSHIVLMNKSEAPYDSMAECIVREDVAEAVKKIEKFLYTNNSPSCNA